MINKKMMLLFDACNTGNVAYILNNLDFENVNYAYCDKRTLLHVACLNNYDLMIDAILKFLPDTNILDKNGMLPIYFLIKNNNLKYVKELVEHTNCTLTNERLFEALVICCLYDNVEIFDYLYKKLKFDIYISDTNGNNLLMFTIKYGSQKLFNYLIKNEFDLNIKNNEGNNSLFFTIVSNNYSAFKFLSNKINVNDTNVYGMNALMVSIMYNRPTIFNDLINQGANVNCFDLDNNNLYHYSILNERLEFISILLDINQDLLKYRNNKGLTPIDLIDKIKNDEFIAQVKKLLNIKDTSLNSGDNESYDETINLDLDYNANNQSDSNSVNELIDEKIDEIYLMIKENEEANNKISSEKIIDNNFLILENTFDDKKKENDISKNDDIDSYTEKIEDDQNIDEEIIDKKYIILDEISDDFFKDDFSSGINKPIIEDDFTSKDDKQVIELNNLILNETNIILENKNDQVNKLNKEHEIVINLSKKNNIKDYLSDDNLYRQNDSVKEIKTKEKMDELKGENMSSIGNTNIKWLLNENEIKKIIHEKKETYMSTTIKISPAIYFSKIGKTKELFNILREDGKKAHEKTCTGKTALMYASQYNNFNCARLLILVGANVNAIDENGSSALHYACYMNNYDLVKLLVDNGANTSIQDNNGVTALDIAIKHENEKISKLLIAVSKGSVINPTKKIVLSDTEYI